jgi:hypothetical protein
MAGFVNTMLLKVSYVILLCSVVIGAIVDYFFRATFPFWFVPVITGMTAMFLILGYRGWTEHW